MPTYPIPIISLALLYGTRRCSRLLYYTFLSRPESHISPFLPCRYVCYLETKFWVLGVLTAIGVSLLPGPLVDRARNICIYEQRHTHTPLHLFLFLYLATCVENQELTLILPKPAQHYRIHPSFLPFLVCNFFHQQWETNQGTLRESLMILNKGITKLGEQGSGIYFSSQFVP